MGPSVIAVADRDRELARVTAQDMAYRMRARRREFHVRCPDSKRAVRLALMSADARLSWWTWAITSAADPRAMGPYCSGSYYASEAKNAIVVIHDPAAVRTAIAAGVGGLFDRPIGGHLDKLHGEPVPVRGTVRSIHDGSWIEDQPRHGGRRYNDQGLTAVIEIDGPILVVLNSLRTPPFSLGQLTSLAIEPARQSILVVKAAVAYKAAYAPIARRVIEVDTPGLTGIDPGRFHFERALRAKNIQID